MTDRPFAAPIALEGLAVASQAGRFPSVLLLTVPKGEGLALQLDLAQAILCPNAVDLAACGVCPDCKRFRTGHSRLLWLLPQVSEEMAQKIEPYGPEAILKDPWTVASPPSAAQIPIGGENTDPTYPMMVAGVRGLAGRLAMSEREPRVVMVPYADQLNQSSSNALLKILEEPPDKVHFILATPAVDRVLPTIRSRSFLQAVPPWAATDLVSFLQARGVPAETAAEASRRSLGWPGAALAMCAPEARAVRQRAREWLALCKADDAERAFAWILESEELAAKDRRPSQQLLQSALGELENELRSVQPQMVESMERLRQGMEQALRDITNHARPQMAYSGAWLSIHA